MIQEKYRRRECGELKRLDSSRKVIEITPEDIRRSGANLSDTVIDIARAVRRAGDRLTKLVEPASPTNTRSRAMIGVLAAALPASAYP